MFQGSLEVAFRDLGAWSLEFQLPFMVSGLGVQVEDEGVGVQASGGLRYT